MDPHNPNVSEPRVSIAQEPLSPEQIRSSEKCLRGFSVYAPGILKEGYFSLGSLVFECSDYSQIWNRLGYENKKINIEEVLKLNEETKHQTPRCRHSLYSLIFCSFLNKDFAAQVSQANLSFALQSKFHIESGEYLVDTSLTNCYLNSWLDVFVSLQTVAKSISNSDNNANMEVYMLVVKEIVKHPMWCQKLLEDACNLRCGLLMNLATKLTVENINWMMSKMKITVSINLLHQLFCSPSIMGKCAALFQLLEVHELLWRSINVASLEALIPVLYTIIEWIFEKCKAAKDYIIGGFKWVSAKFRRGENEENKYPNIRPDLPETLDKATAQCSSTFVPITTFVSRGKFVSDILNVTAQAEACTSYNNSCLFEAVASGTTLDPKQLRDQCLDLLTSGPEKFYDAFVHNGFSVEEAEVECATLVKNLDGGQMVGVSIFPVLEQLIEKNIIGYSLQDGKLIYMTNSNASFSTKVFVRNDGTHWYSTTEQKACGFSLLGVALDGKQPESIAEIAEEICAQTNVPAEEVTEMVTKMEETELGRSFLDWLRSAVGDVYQFFAKNAIIGGIIAFIFSMTAAFGIGISKFKTYGDKRSFWENISGASRDFYHLSQGQNSITKVFTDFGAILKQMMDIDDQPEITAFKQALLDTAEKAEELNKFCQFQPEEITNDPQKLTTLKNELDQMRKRYQELTKYGPQVNLQSLTPIWHRMTAAYCMLQANHAKICNRSERRVQPVCVWFWGKSNIGKSEFVSHFVAEINKAQGTAWETFTVSKGPDYLNGFNQQKIILIDDFDSFSMVEGCLDALLVMNMKTSAPYNPNLAALEDKLLQARPSLIIISSNFQTAKLNCGVNDMLAFERRRDFLVHVTWEGPHEKCDVTDTACEHWHKVKYEDNGNRKEYMTFDHLTLTRDHPLVYSNPQIYKDAPKILPKNKECQAPPLSKVNHLGKIAVDNLVRETLEKMRDFEAVHKAVMRELNEVKENAIKKSKAIAQASPEDAVQEDVEDWQQVPNILLRGPPGTGKSQALKKVCSMNQETFKYILTLSEFNAASSSQWNFPGYKAVLFDDYTTFKDSPYIKDFWTLWKRRVDQGDSNQPIWIMGMNDSVAIASFQTYEEFEVMTRPDRAASYFFKYNQKSRAFYDFFSRPEFYGPADTKDVPEGKTYGDIVSITCGEDRILFESLIGSLNRWKPSRRTKSNQVALPVITHLHVDALSKVPVSSDEFVKIVNSTGTSSQAISMLVNCSFQSPKFSKLQIGKRIATTFSNMLNFHNSQFYDMDEFILCGSNNGFFQAFNDGNFVLEYTDKAYCLTTLNNRVIAGIYDPIDIKGDMSQCLKSLSQSISTFDFLKVTKSRLPPWIVVATAMIEDIFKFSCTGMFIPLAIKQNNVMFKASVMEDTVDRVRDEFVETSYEKTAKDSATRLLDPPKTVVNVLRPIPAVVESPGSKKDRREDGQNVKNKAHRSESNQQKRAQAIVRPPTPTGIGGCAECAATFEISSPLNSELGSCAAAATVAIFEKVPEVTPELSTDVAVFDVINAVARNMVNIETLDGKHVVHGLMIHGKLGTTVGHITYKHQLPSLRARTYKGETFLITPKRHDPEIDLLDFEIAGNHKFPNIIKHLAAPEHDYFGQRLGVMVSMSHADKDLSVMTVRYFRIKMYQTVQLNGMHSVQAWSYGGGLSGFQSEMPPQTKAGDCGSIMFLCDPSRERKVIGMHVASNDTTGFFRNISYPQYPLEAKAQSCEMRGFMNEFTEPLYDSDLQGRHVLSKCVYRPHLADKTKLYCSPFKYGNVEYEPSVLSCHDPRAPDVDDMVRKESYKWLEEPMIFPDNVKNKIRERFTVLGDWLGQRVAAYGVTTSVLTKRSALNAVKGYRHSQPIPVGTSAGYPLNHRVKNGKLELISVNDADGSRNFTDNVTLKNLFHASIDHVLNAAKKGHKADVAYLVFPKDELLKKDKLKIKTRTIAAAPLGLVVALRMYFHPIYAALCEIWNAQPVKVGISPMSLDWHELAISLLRVGQRGFSLDQTDFDFQIPKELSEGVVYALDAIAQLTDENYTDEDRAMRFALHENVSDFNIIIRGLVYNVKRGVPSGHPGTAVENSLISLFCLYDAYCELAPSWMSITIESFFAQIAPAVYGDDALVMVHPTIEKWFNLQSVSEYLTRTYGLKITAADKSNEQYTVKPLKDLTFLSRSFRHEDGYWVGPLEMRRLIKPLNFCAGKKSHHWYKEKERITDDVDIAVCAARSALDEMFFHGQKEYDKLRRHCVKVASNLGVTDAYFPSYIDAKADYFDMTIGENRTLYLYNFPVAHSVVHKLSQEPNWISYNNRRCCLFGAAYSWDERTAKIIPNEIPLYLANILRQANALCNENFNQVLVNEYRPPGGCIPYHKDDEPGLDLEAGVASVTLIGDGVMTWCEKNGKIVYSELMQPNMMYHMQGKFLTEYLHKRDQHHKFTLSLTFRRVSAS